VRQGEAKLILGFDFQPDISRQRIGCKTVTTPSSQSETANAKPRAKQRRSADSAYNTGLDRMSDGFHNLTRPGKQKRALLRSNPPRDNWIKAMKQTSAQARPSGLPSLPEQRFVPELSPCLKNLSGRTAVRLGIERKPLTIVANSRPSVVQVTLNQCNETASKHVCQIQKSLF